MDVGGLCVFFVLGLLSFHFFLYTYRCTFLIINLILKSSSRSGNSLYKCNKDYDVNFFGRKPYKKKNLHMISTLE